MLLASLSLEWQQFVKEERGWVLVLPELIVLAEDTCTRICLVYKARVRGLGWRTVAFLQKTALLGSLDLNLGHMDSTFSCIQYFFLEYLSSIPETVNRAMSRESLLFLQCRWGSFSGKNTSQLYSLCKIDPTIFYSRLATLRLLFTYEAEDLSSQLHVYLKLCSSN